MQKRADAPGAGPVPGGPGRAVTLVAALMAVLTGVVALLMLAAGLVVGAIVRQFRGAAGAGMRRRQGTSGGRPGTGDSRGVIEAEYQVLDEQTREARDRTARGGRRD